MVVSASKYLSFLLTCKLNRGSLLSINGGRFSFLGAIRKPVRETKRVDSVYTRTIF